MSENNELIPVLKCRQPAVIDQNLMDLSARLLRIAETVKAMPKTRENLPEIRRVRAELNEYFNSLETQRKLVKAEVLLPYEQANKVYEDVVKRPIKEADALCKGFVEDVETAVKKECEDTLREYFTELCQMKGIFWLPFERLGIKVTLGSLVRMLLDLFELHLMKFFPGLQKPDTKHGRIVAKLGMSVDCSEEKESLLWPRPTTGAPLCGGTGNFKQMQKLRDAGIITEEERRNLTCGSGGNISHFDKRTINGKFLGIERVRKRIAQEKTNELLNARPLREFCVSDFRQNQEYHVINVHDEG